MLWYRLKRVIFPNRYLSIKVEIQKPVPPLNFCQKVLFFIKKYWLWLIGFFVFFLIFDILFGLNLIIETKQLKEILKAFIAVPLGLIAIVIPIIILSIDSISERIGWNSIKIYLDPLKPTEVFLISILYLGFIISSLYIISIITVVEFVNMLLITLGITSVIVPLIGTIFIVNKTIELVRDDSL